MLKVKTTRTVTTEELDIFCDPPLTFEATGNIGPGLWEKLREWAANKYPPEQAANFVPQLFLSVAQNGKSYPLITPEAVEGLRQAVGDEFLSDLVENYWTYEATYFKKKRLASANSSTGQDVGKESEPPT